MNFKLRAQLTLALVVIVVSSVFTFFHITKEKRYTEERSYYSTESVKMAFDSMVADIEHFYIFRAYTTLHLEGVVDAIKNENSDALYQLVLPRYQALIKENPHLILMQFHAHNGRSILRMHLKEKHGDDIASRRPMLREIHTTHQMVSGFEGGIYGVGFRIVIPVFEDDVYVGALELGISSKYFVDKIKQMTGSNSVLMIHQEHLGAADRSHYQEGIGEYRYAAINEEYRHHMKLFALDNPTLLPKIIHVDNGDYEINPLELKDSQQRNTGLIVCINNVTGRYQDIGEIIGGSITLTLLLLLVFWGLFKYVFQTLLQKLKLQEQYIKTILDSQQNLVVVTDGLELVYANKAFFDFFNYKNMDQFKKDHQCICHFFEAGNAEEYLQPKMKGLSWLDHLVTHTDREHKAKISVGGESYIFKVHAEKMEYENDTRHVVVFTDITRLNELATRDVLTHVANRFEFDKMIEHCITVAQRYGRAVSIILIDIDHFKQINDNYGHLEGDEVLKKIANVLVEGIRKSDLVARWGGEEFVILLPDSELSAAVKLSETLRAKIESTSFGAVSQLTCSMGVARWNEGENTNALLKRVDDNLYRAKEQGRNCVVS